MKPINLLSIGIASDHAGYDLKETIKKYLEENNIEGLVFWKDGEPKCKIKRTDFGFEWNGK